MKRKIAIALSFVASVLLAGAVQAATYTTYTSYAGWLGAIGGSPVVENFDDAVLQPGFSITEIGGAGTIVDGVYMNIAVPGDLRYQIVNYASGMSAFGGWWDLTPGGPGTGLDVSVGSTIALTIPNSAAGQFFGFASNDIFTSVKIAAGTQSGVQETYWAVDMQLKPAPVPIPGAALLLGSGLAGLGIFGRRKKA